MTYIVSSGALNSTPTNQPTNQASYNTRPGNEVGYDGKDLKKRKVLSLEWKSECVTFGWLAHALTEYKLNTSTRLCHCKRCLQREGFACETER